MAKTKVHYLCQVCGVSHQKWSGQCSQCSLWNTLVEETVAPTNASSRFSHYAGASEQVVSLLSEVASKEEARIETGLSELDRVLGGGIVAGSVILIGGDPGIGKSTLLLQTLAKLSLNIPCLYVTGEESLQQVSLRAKRLDLAHQNLFLLAETCVEKIIQTAMKQKPQIMVIDSIQTIFTELLTSAPGGVGQVRESAAQLVRFAKQTGIALFLVGHVTKDGSLAGPRVLEHMVDAVLYFEGESDSRFRVIRAMKNRFGAVNELGVFAMTDKGLRGIQNPSALFLSRYDHDVCGSGILVTWEGTRPLLVEVQALAADTPLANPRRVCLGMEQNRLSMLLAVLHRHGQVPTYQQDIFVNIVGGVRISETAADLAAVCAVVSSIRNKAIAKDTVIFGEVGLAGEIRPVQSGLERLKEASKHGFKRAIIPQANCPKSPEDYPLEIIAVTQLKEALQAI